MRALLFHAALCACSTPSEVAPLRDADAVADADEVAVADADEVAIADAHSDAVLDADAVPVADAASDTVADADAPCKPIARYTFPFPTRTVLACGASAAKVALDVDVPARGRAFARANVVVRHQGPPVVHFWNVRVDVGKAELQYGIGDDVCPGTTAKRANVGLGSLEDADHRVRVHAYQGSSPCTDGALSIELGSSLDVWVEDPRPACRNKDLKAASWYQTSGVTKYYEWTTSMTKLVETSITTEAKSEKLLVLGVVEGTPHTNPNSTCGSEAATLVMQTTAAGAIVSTAKDVVPASLGMGHLVLSSEAERSVPPGTHPVTLLVGSNFVGRVTTGGCCGDGTVAVLRLR